MTARRTLPPAHGPRQGEASPVTGVDGGGSTSSGSELDSVGLTQLNGAWW
jgi:hypothetical protein